MRCLHYNGMTIGIDAPESAWLEQFVIPAFQPSRQEPDVVVRMKTEGYEQALAMGPHPDGGRVDLFQLDGTFESHPLWRGEPMTACDREHGLIYRFGEEIEVLTAGAVRWQRLALLRLLRELAAAHSVSRGGLLVHGAGLAFQDEAIALVGPRRSGKTTLLTHALRTPGARFLSNDRLVLTNDGTLLPLPTIVSVRPGPYRLLPHPATDWAGESVAEPRGISPGQFCALADTEPVAQARLTTLVFPRLCAETRGLEPRPLLPSQAAEQLKNNLFDRRGRCRPSLFQAPEPSWSPETLRHVRCLECRLGSDAYLQPAEVLFRVPA